MTLTVFIGLMYIILVAIAARLFGNLVMTLGRLDDRNPKGAFWLSAGLYSLICFGLAWLLFREFGWPSPERLILLCAPLYISPLYPVISYFVKRANPDVFKPRAKPADPAREVTKSPPEARKH